MSTERLTYLYRKAIGQDDSTNEREELFTLLQQHPDLALEMLSQPFPDIQSVPVPEDLRSDILKSIFLAGKPNAEQPRSVPFLRQWGWAAAVILVLGTAAYIWTTGTKKEPLFTGTGTSAPIDISPGGNKAVLTLADGRIIVLDSAANGALANEGSTQIVKLEAGKLAYQGSGLQGAAGFNTITTPNGGSYQITLADGSKVWLNAASSIRFPAAFGKERRVEVTGEVYLEVKSDKTKPFSVKALNEEIQVLGTSFNINAYADEPAVKTSLLEGRIRIGGTVLKPGQAFVDGQVVPANVEQDLAWKNGFFNFRNKSLPEVMRQIARWYDLEVIYPARVPDITLVGDISRSMQLTEMLQTLKQLEIHFTMKGRTITILP